MRSSITISREGAAYAAPRLRSPALISVIFSTSIDQTTTSAGDGRHTVATSLNLSVATHPSSAFTTAVLDR